MLHLSEQRASPNRAACYPLACFSATVDAVRILRFGWHQQTGTGGLALGNGLLLGAIATIALGVSCGDSRKSRTPHGGVAGPTPSTPVAASPTAATAPIAAPSDAVPAAVPAVAVPAVDEPQELTVIKARVVNGDRSTRTLKELQKLSYRYPKNAEIAYILGQFYCEKLWMKDGLGYFRKAIQHDGAFRTNPYLIKAVVAGLGNDGDHKLVEQFLVQDIGPSAAPFLEEVLEGTWRKQVKDRATDILRQLK